ncbi:MAG: transposase [Candidatus Competibacteraceae bacterium]|nr:transposase [Candidatus Competibacteraceae bacterium]MBK8898948.1 transposase [Candidatus Competibacteraceae bacterium]MBK8963904.1 transposase [Candidatus Competibacteraceae bacterium]
MVSPSQANTRQRRSLRLRDYDYTQAGAYFLTICTHQRSSWFGHIENDAMVLNEFGEIVREEWLLSGDIRAEIELGDYVIMPNHLHGIVWIVANEDQGIKATDLVGATGRSPLPASAPIPTGPPPKSIGAFVAGFKSAATKRINQIRQTPAAPVWQRNYYEHVIRNEADYQRIAEYIDQNPQRWAMDSLNPINAPQS